MMSTHDRLLDFRLRRTFRIFGGRDCKHSAVVIVRGVFEFTCNWAGRARQCKVAVKWTPEIGQFLKMSTDASWR